MHDQGIQQPTQPPDVTDAVLALARSVETALGERRSRDALHDLLELLRRLSQMEQLAPDLRLQREVEEIRILCGLLEPIRDTVREQGESTDEIQARALLAEEGLDLMRRLRMLMEPPRWMVGLERAIARQGALQWRALRSRQPHSQQQLGIRREFELLLRTVELGESQHAWIVQDLNHLLHELINTAMADGPPTAQVTAQLRQLADRLAGHVEVDNGLAAALNALVQAQPAKPRPGGSGGRGSMVASPGDSFAEHESYSVEELDAWEAPRSLRRYQRLLAQGIPFRVRDGGGTVYRCLWCHAEAGRNHLDLEEVSDGGRLRLSSDLCGSGYRLSGQTITELPDANRSERRPTEPPPALVRVGNSNFAHFIWNELDGLLQLIQQVELLEVVQDKITVLDLAELDSLKLVAHASLASRPSVYPGAMVVTPQVRELVLHHLRVPPQRPAAAENGCQPTLLVGVRGPGKRELVNEEEVICGLLKALSEQLPDARILLDGFSFQLDNLHDSGARSRSDAVMKRIEKIIHRSRGGNIDVISGLPIAEALAKIRHVNWYVTHEGTMQHKIGWFFPWIPGVCLCGPNYSAAVARWHQQQCFGSVAVEQFQATFWRMPTLTMTPSRSVHGATGRFGSSIARKP